jgi:hypothetical protein
VVFGSTRTLAVTDVVLFVASGGTRQPIARFDGERWTATCTAAAGATSAPMQPVRRVTASSPEWNPMQRAIAEIFTRREREQRVAAARIDSAPMTVDAVYASGPAANATYYFEASRRVEGTSRDADPDTDPAGVLTVRVTGWLRAAGGGLTPIGSKADVEWEQLDRAQPSRVDLTPIGTVRQADALVWVMKRETAVPATFMLYDTQVSTVRLLLRSQC